MKQTTKRFASMVMALLFVVMALVLYVSFIQPAYDDAQTIKGQMLGEEQFLASEEAAIKQVQDLISTYQSQAQVQQAVSLALPTTEDIAGGLAQLTGLAVASNLQVKSVQLSSVPVQAAAQAQGTGQAANQSFSSLLKPMGTETFQIKISGSYEDFKNFITRLATNIRVFDVKNVTINQNTLTASGGKTPLDLYDIDISVDTYYQVR